MFDDHWKICCRSQDSAGKRTIKTPCFGRSGNSRKIPEVILSRIAISTEIEKIYNNRWKKKESYFARRLKKPEGGGERSHRAGSCHRGERAYAMRWLKLGPNVHWKIRRREGAV
jgi:hypothetical protein